LGFLPEIDEAAGMESLKTLKRNFGLVPKIYRAQLLRPDLVEGRCGCSIGFCSVRER